MSASHAASLFALSVALSFASAGCKKPEAKPQEKAAEVRVHVETAVATLRSVPKQALLTGILEASERTDLAANANGKVLRVLVELGQRVEAGASIAQLDVRMAAMSQTEVNANATNAAEQLATLQRDCDRYKILLEKQAISQQEHDRAMGQCRAQTAALEAARARAGQVALTVRDGTIRAPFAGRIAARFVHVGDYVRPDTKIVTLLADEPLRLRLTLPERDIAAARAGVVVTFDTVGAPGRTFSATLRFIGREVRAQTRDLLVEGVVDERDDALLPGMFVTARMPTGELKVPVVPQRAVVTHDETQTLFVVNGERLQQRVVQTGAKTGEDVAILDGVKDGERVVASPSESTVDGALVD